MPDEKNPDQEQPEPFRFTFEEQESKRLEQEERRLVLIEKDAKRLQEDLELHKQEVQRNEERYQERVNDAKAEREEWRRHVAHVEKTNGQLIDALTRIALAVEERSR